MLECLLHIQLLENIYVSLRVCKLDKFFLTCMMILPTGVLAGVCCQRSDQSCFCWRAVVDTRFCHLILRYYLKHFKGILPSGRNRALQFYNTTFTEDDFHDTVISASSACCILQSRPLQPWQRMTFLTSFYKHFKHIPPSVTKTEPYKSTSLTKNDFPDTVRRILPSG